MLVARHLKILVALCVAGLAGLYGIQNLFNISEAHGFVSLMLSQQERPAYPSGLIPPIGSAAIAWAILAIIIITELVAAACALIGAWSMFQNRNASDGFSHSKHMAMLGAGLGVLIWFGYFQVIGGAGLQMWQAQAGQGPMTGSFQYAVLCFLALIFLAQAEPENS